MWTDHETERDFLNFSGVAKTVAEIIVQANGKPISIGVSGAWGVGKSSMIKLIRKSLVERKAPGDREFVYVEFNAWLYQGYDDARAALMEVIAQKLEAEAIARKTGREKVKDFLARINWFRAAKLAITTGAAAYLGLPPPVLIESIGNAVKKLTSGDVDAETIEKAKEGAEAVLEEGRKLLEPREASSSPPKEIHGLRKSFEDALDEMGITLVVLIDDLDRCLPETTISTLEAIRLFLFLRNTAFVIAADDEMIKHAVKRHFTEITDKLVINYFDKLIQLPIRVPPLGTQEVRAYMMLLYIDNTTIDQEKKETIRAAVCERLGQSWQGKRVDREYLTETFKDLTPDVISKLDAAERLSTLMATASGIGGNPRLIKRFMNALSIRMAIARAQDVAVDEGVLAKLLLFERLGDSGLYSQIAGSVLRDPAGNPQVLAQLERDALSGAALPAEWDNPFAREWLLLPPTLADKDLRGALYVSREHTPLITPEDRLSSEGMELLTAVLSTPSRARSLKDRLTKLPRTETPIIMDRLLTQARQVDSWGSPPILDALIHMAEIDPIQGPRLAGFLLERPHSHIKADVVPRISDQPWAKDILSTWEKSSAISQPVKSAIKTIKGPKK